MNGTATNRCLYSVRLTGGFQPVRRLLMFEEMDVMRLKAFVIRDFPSTSNVFRPHPPQTKSISSVRERKRVNEFHYTIRVELEIDEFRPFSPIDIDYCPSS